MKPLHTLKNCAAPILPVLVIVTGLAVSPALAKQGRQAAIQPAFTLGDSRSESDLDAYGNLVRENGSKFNYLVLPEGFIRVQLSEDNTPIATQSLSQNPFDETKRVDASLNTLVPEAAPLWTSEYLTQRWKTGIWGTGIGASGIAAFDIDGDGVQEIVLGGGYGFGDNRFWYILSYSAATGKYQQEWMGEQYSSTISRILVTDVVSGQYLIYVALSNGQVRIYDATTRELLGGFSSPFTSISDMTIADVDNDGEQEIVTSSSSGLVVHHAETYAVEWQTASYGSGQVEVANVDGDIAPEIVTTMHVIDGISHTLEWSYSSGFGAIVQLADIDGDTMAEIVAAESWYRINAFDADIHSPKWDIPVDLDIDALIVTDFDQDGVQEVVYGDGQWGYVHVIDSTTRAQEWVISNPEHGVTDIGFGDVDNDGVLEILWGAGWSSTGSDHLFVGSTVTHSIEWRSQDIGGPLSALDVGDVDNDGTNEIVMVSFESDSGYNDGIIFIYDARTYELEWQSQPILNGRAWTGVHALVLADVDNDNVLEILIATANIYDGLIMAYDGLTHNLDWQTVGHNGTFFSALAVADIDNDGQLEVVGGQDREHTGAPGVYVRVFDGSTGIEEWRTTNLTYWGGVFDIDTGDYDQDGNPEILFSVTDGYAYVYDGVTHVQEWHSSFSNTRAVAGFDVDQDGDQEILVGTSNGQLYAFNGQTFVQEWSQTLSSRSINSLRLADVNRDLVPELVLTDSSYLAVYDAGTRALVWMSGYLGDAVGNRGHLVVDDIDRDTRIEVVLGSSYALYVFGYSLLPYGPLLSVDRSLAVPGDQLHYTAQLVNISNGLLSAVVTDTVPASTLYETGSLWASSGSWGLVNDTIAWTVELTTSEVVSLTFAATVGPLTADDALIVNTAHFTAGGFLDSRQVSTRIDALPPVSTIVQPIPDEIISGAAYTVTGTAMDTVSGVERVEVRIDDGNWQLATGSMNWMYLWTLPLTDDTFTIQARSVDRVGHVETPGPSVSVWVDNLSPYMVSVTPAHGSTNVPIDAPIVIVFSEPILTDTLDLNCQPAVDNWSIDVSADGTTVTLSHAPFSLEQMYSCFVSQVRDRADHGLIPGTVVNPWAFVTTGQASVVQHNYLPLILNNFVPPSTFPVHIGDPIPVRAVAYPGEVFYTTIMRIPEELPAGGHFYFSSEPDRVAAAVVDDALVMLLDGAQVFAYDFSTGGSPVPAVVEVPRATMEQLAGQTVTIEYHDRYARVVRASEMWLIWVP